MENRLTHQIEIIVERTAFDRQRSTNFPMITVEVKVQKRNLAIFNHKKKTRKTPKCTHFDDGHRMAVGHRKYVRHERYVRFY